MISTEQISEFRANGATCIRAAVTLDEVTALLRQLDRLIASENDRWTTIRSGGFSDRHLWPTMPWMREFCTNSRLPEIAARLMESRSARLYFDHTFIRDPGTGQDTPWHQDQPYWPFRGQQIISVWVALTACEPASSGLRFIRGSHAWDKIYRPIAFSKDSGSAKFLDKQYDLEEMPDFEAMPDDYDILGWDMQPGDAIVFSALAVHGASKNNDLNHRRAAISVRYVGDDARWDPRPGTDPIVTAEMAKLEPGDRPTDERWFPEVYCR